MKTIEKLSSLLKGNKGQGILSAFVGIVAVIIMLQIFVIVLSNIQTATNASALTSGMSAANGNITANTVTAMNLASLYPLIAIAGLMIGAFIVGFMNIGH